MIGQRQAGWITPENQTHGHETDSAEQNQPPPHGREERYGEGATEDNVAGQGADQLTDADRARLKGE